MYLMGSLYKAATGKGEEVEKPPNPNVENKRLEERYENIITDGN